LHQRGAVELYAVIGGHPKSDAECLVDQVLIYTFSILSSHA